jgi:sulfatase modifying factor 1
MTKKVSLLYINPKDGAEMVLVPGGWFWMGSDDSDPDAENREKPRHLHWLAPFYISITSVTVRQFKQFVRETGYANDEDWDTDPSEHPVKHINWHDAKDYCEWAGLRLPTEAEWELCARGYGALKYPWGNDWENGRRVCWDKPVEPEGNTTPVFGHPEGVSNMGTFQQSGNLWEWCEDNWDEDAYKRYVKGNFEPPAASNFRVLRGGSWNFNSPRLFRGAFRYDYPQFRSLNLGFRTARAVTF